MQGVVDQLLTELDTVAGRVKLVFGGEVAAIMDARTDALADVLAMQLCGDDDGLAATTTVDVLALLFGDLDPPDAWWITPLGRACARSLGSEHATSWTQSITASYLGVAVGTVKSLVARGTLARHPDGGLVPADVVRYSRERRTS